MKKENKAKKKIGKRKLLKGWKLKIIIHTGEIWQKGNKKLLYDHEKKEVVHIWPVY